MKIVRENISEKFVDASDPIKDMQIGQHALWKKADKELFGAGGPAKVLYIKFFKEYCPDIYDEHAYVYIVRVILHTIHRVVHLGMTPEKAYKEVRKEEFWRDKDLPMDYKITVQNKILEILEKKYQMSIDPDKKINEKFTADSDPIRDMGIGIHTGWRKKYNDKPILTYIFYLKDSMGNEKQYRVQLFYKNRPDNKHGSVDAIWFGSERLIQGWNAYGGSNLHIGNMQNKPERFFGTVGDDESTFWIDPKIFDKEIIDPMATRNKETISKMMNELCDAWFESSNFILMIKQWIRSGVCRVDHIKLTIM